MPLEGDGMDRVVSTRKFDRAVQVNERLTRALFVAERGWRRSCCGLSPTVGRIQTSPVSPEDRVSVQLRGLGRASSFLGAALSGSAGRRYLGNSGRKGVVVRPGMSSDLRGKPFLCLRGIREYHSHNRHLGDLWENYRPLSSYGLLSIIDRVQQRFNDSNG